MTQSVLEKNGIECFAKDDQDKNTDSSPDQLFINAHNDLLKKLERLDQMASVTQVSVFEFSRLNNDFYQKLKVAHRQMFANLDVGTLDDFLLGRDREELMAHGYCLDPDTPPFQVLQDIVLRQQLHEIVRGYIEQVEHLVPRSPAAKSSSFRETLWRQLQPVLGAYLDGDGQMDRNDEVVAQTFEEVSAEVPPIMLGLHKVESGDQKSSDDSISIIVHEVDKKQVTQLDELQRYFQWSIDEKSSETKPHPMAVYYLKLIIQYCVYQDRLPETFLIKDIHRFNEEEVNQIYRAVEYLQDDEGMLKIPFLHLTLLTSNTIKNSSDPETGLFNLLQQSTTFQKTINFRQICEWAGLAKSADLIEDEDSDDEASLSSAGDIQFIPMQIGLPDRMISNGHVVQWPEASNDAAVNQFIQLGMRFLRESNKHQSALFRNIRLSLHAINEELIKKKKQSKRLLSTDQNSILIETEDNIVALMKSLQISQGVLAQIKQDDEVSSDAQLQLEALTQQLESLSTLFEKNEQAKGCFARHSESVHHYLKYLQGFSTIIRMHRQHKAKQIEPWSLGVLARLVYCCKQMGIGTSMVSSLDSKRSEALFTRLKEMREYVNQYTLLPPLREPSVRLHFDKRVSQLPDDAFFAFPQIESSDVQQTEAVLPGKPSERYQTPDDWFAGEAVDLIGSTQWWLEQDMQRWFYDEKNTIALKSRPARSNDQIQQQIRQSIWVVKEGDKKQNKLLKNKGIKAQALSQVVEPIFTVVKEFTSGQVHVWVQPEGWIKKTFTSFVTYYPSTSAKAALTSAKSEQTTKPTLSDEQQRLIKLVKAVLTTGEKDRQGLPTGSFHLGFSDYAATQQPTDSMVQIMATFLAIREYNGITSSQLKLAFYDDKAEGQYIESLGDIEQRYRQIRDCIQGSNSDLLDLKSKPQADDHQISFSVEEQEQKSQPAPSARR